MIIYILARLWPVLDDTSAIVNYHLKQLWRLMIFISLCRFFLSISEFKCYTSSSVAIYQDFQIFIHNSLSFMIQSHITHTNYNMINLMFPYISHKSLHHVTIHNSYNTFSYTYNYIIKIYSDYTVSTPVLSNVLVLAKLISCSVSY